MATYKAVVNGITHKDLVIGGQKHKAVYAGDRLIWEKQSKYHVFEFEYYGDTYISAYAFSPLQYDIVEVYYTNSQGRFKAERNLEDKQYVELKAPGLEHGICSVYMASGTEAHYRMRFWYNPSITKILTPIPPRCEIMAYGFAHCRHLCEIPENLFENYASLNMNTVNLRHWFENCIALITVPEKLFDVFLAADSIIESAYFANLFHNCRYLENCPKLYELFPNSVYDTGGDFHDPSAKPKAFGTGCYYNAYSLPYYSRIPEVWTAATGTLARPDEPWC